MLLEFLTRNSTPLDFSKIPVTVILINNDNNNSNNVTIRLT